MSYRGSVGRSLRRSKRIEEKMKKGLCVKCDKPNNTSRQLCLECREEIKLKRLKRKSL